MGRADGERGITMTPEAAVKAKIKDILKELQCYSFSPIGGAYSSRGVPDIVGCLNGVFFGIEAKAGKGKTTALQDRELQRIKDAGGIALVVNEENLDRLKMVLQEEVRKRM
jgi:Holliday junction resolvase